MSNTTETYQTKQYGGICIGVGGIKGILQSGAIHEFWVRGQLKNLTYYSGSSAGGMIAALLCIGYEPIDLLTSLCTPDFANQMNSNLNFMNLPTIYGLYPNSIIRKKIEQMFMLKLGYLPTFLDIKNKLHKFLTIPIYCISEKEIKNRKIYCSPVTTPDMQVVDAIVLTCSIPLVFQKAVYKDKVYIDGAYTSTFPIQALQDVCPIECPILGICIKDEEINLDSFIGYSSAILTIPLQEQHNLCNMYSDIDVIEIQADSSVSAFNFNLSVREKIHMFNFGVKQVKDLLSSRESDQVKKLTNKKEVVDVQPIEVKEKKE